MELTELEIAFLSGLLTATNKCEPLMALLEKQMGTMGLEVFGDLKTKFNVR